MCFEYPARWFGEAVLLDNELIFWIYNVHCDANCSSVGDIRPSLVGSRTGKRNSLIKMGVTHVPNRIVDIFLSILYWLIVTLTCSVMKGV
jgi:hypothetical protein